ncbi:MAG TPA: 16S rRNA (cytidine(1402)-2'-O)-methyltransferase [Thermoanaerobaculia bacterium]|jgi:16S rRNA (cytidine1402-2'-O)-methyltransferase|nr:16S rRNA (cytidine(1402)-2'-O)-methyltransferase [Thermoanaerobaculia bacterium]
MSVRGKLLIVGTPIGNLSDMSPRAVEALQSADVILCEDTRHTRKLLTHFRIEKPAERYDDHTEDEKAAHYIDRIDHGEVVAIVSDAGMPLVSDPGYRIVRMARERGITIEPIPGPFAGVLALVASGIAPLPFTFLGFTPHRSGERRDFYRNAADLGHTFIVYESPERIVDSLEDALAVLGDTEATVAREMTKMHEEIVSGSVSEMLDQFRERPSIYGEITIVFAAPKAQAVAASPAEIRAEFERLRAEGMRRNDAVKLVAEKFGLRKNDVYRLLL